MFTSPRPRNSPVPRLYLAWTAGIGLAVGVMALGLRFLIPTDAIPGTPWVGPITAMRLVSISGNRRPTSDQEGVVRLGGPAGIRTLHFSRTAGIPPAGLRVGDSVRAWVTVGVLSSEGDVLRLERQGVALYDITTPRAVLRQRRAACYLVAVISLIVSSAALSLLLLQSLPGDRLTGA